MKTFLNTIFGILAISGLLISGADSNYSFLTQMIINICGVILFFISMFFICKINKP